MKGWEKAKTDLLLYELRLILLKLLELLKSLESCSSAVFLAVLKLKLRRRSESRGSLLPLLLVVTSSSVVLLSHPCELTHERSQVDVPCVYETLTVVVVVVVVVVDETVEDGLEVGF